MDRIPKMMYAWAAALLLLLCLAAGKYLLLHPQIARAAEPGDASVGRFQASCAQIKDDEIKCVVLDTTDGSVLRVYRFDGDNQCEKKDSMNYLFWCR